MGGRRSCRSNGARCSAANAFVIAIAACSAAGGPDGSFCSSANGACEIRMIQETMSKINNVSLSLSLNGRLSVIEKKERGRSFDQSL